MNFGQVFESKFVRYMISEKIVHFYKRDIRGRVNNLWSISFLILAKNVYIYIVVNTKLTKRFVKRGI